MHVYPQDLLPIVKSLWSNVRFPAKGSDNLPDDDIILSFLDVAYQASLLSEEKRQLGFRLIYLPRKQAKESKKGIPTHPHHFPIIFDQDIRFTPSDLLRLAPATDPKRILIAVDSEPGPHKALRIWGLLDIGSTWWDLWSNESSMGIPPPDGLSITVARPGNMIVCRGGEMITGIRQGQIAKIQGNVFWKGPVSDFFDDPADAFYKQVLTGGSWKKWDEDGHDEDYPKNQYVAIIQRLLNKIAAIRHGASLIVVRDYLSLSDGRLQDRIQVKFPCKDVELWRLGVDSMIAHKNYFAALETTYEDEPTTIEKSVVNAIHRFDHQIEELDRVINDRIAAVAAFTGVDGAVVVTDKLRVLGFGGEVTATSPSLQEIKIAADVNAKDFSSRHISSYGTRHRSAFRFCSSLERVMNSRVPI